MTEGLYGDRVFIASLFRFLRSRGETRTMTLDAFKRRLIEGHKEHVIILSACKRLEVSHPFFAIPSAIRKGKTAFHLVRRFPPPTLGAMLYDVAYALSPEGYDKATAFAEKVRADERRRGERARLITLSTEAFAARVQAVVNEGVVDAHATELYFAFDERGEATGLTEAAFIGRLIAAASAGLLALSTPGLFVRRTDAPSPIPWGKPMPASFYNNESKMPTQAP